MLIDSVDPNKDIREKALKRLKELCLTIAELRDIPELEEPTYEQKEFFVRKMKKGKWI